MTFSERLVIRSLFREYEVVFLDEGFPLLADQSVGAIVVDRRVADLHARRMKHLLEAEYTIVLDATEENKTLEGCRKLIEALVARQFRRDRTLVVVGGGIVQDIAAFSASILYRGVDWIFAPTTLLAQADSCIGSKTSINVSDKKNLIGGFYPPSRVVIDTGFLETLSVEDIKSGIGEILHFYYYANSPMLGQLMSNYDRVLVERGLLRPHIVESLRIKQSVVEKDEFDRGERNKFNYGHTFGHALESATQYTIPHGLAVTVGMDLANYLSVQLGKMSVESFNEMHSVLRRNLPDADLSTIDMNAYVEALTKDKKNVANDLVCILASEPGKLEKVRLPFNSTVIDWIRRYFQHRIFQIDAVPQEARQDA